MQQSSDTAVETTRNYYDSDDADKFYYEVWGGEDIHVGIYEYPGEAIAVASRRTVDEMIGRLGNLGPASRVIDIGSGFAGSARQIARTAHCPVIALNLSPVQNRRARAINASQGLAERISVVDGSFEDLPFADASFDIVWCQDSILHSADRNRVFREVNRVLMPGGEFIFTDPMRQAHARAEQLQPVLDRIHLPSMGSVDLYRGYADELGWDVVSIESQPDAIVKHYSSVLEALRDQEAELAATISADYLLRMQQGLQHWIDAGKQGLLDWGILHFRKPGLPHD